MSGDTATELPWIQGKLRITKEVMDKIDADALRCYPSEACGFAFGPADDVSLIDDMRVEENEADKYHKLDPETFPRTSEMYFKINELRAQRSFEEAQSEGRPLKVIYHSHCNALAYFSDEDAATFASDNVLMWPCAFIVVSVIDGKIKERKLHVHTPGTNSFEESELVIEG